MLAKITSYSCFRACYNCCNEHGASDDNNINEDEQHLPTSSTALQASTETLLFRNNIQHATNAIATRWYNLATCAVTPSVAIYNSGVDCGGGAMTTEKIKDMDMLMMRHMKPASLEDERMFMVRTFSKCSADDDNETTQMLLQQHMDNKNNVSGTQDECLLCLEEFTDTSPVASTVCTCGVNSTRAHLHCLTMWRNSAGKVMCPICSEEVFFDEQQQPAATTVEDEEEDRL